MQASPQALCSFTLGQGAGEAWQLLKNHILLNDDRSQFAHSKRTDFELRLGRWIRDGVSVFIIR
jgi:hypothetical protein